MGKFLSEEKRVLLEAAHAGSNNRIIEDRLKALLLYDKNWTCEQISTDLFIHPDTASRHVNNNKLNNLVVKLLI